MAEYTVQDNQTGREITFEWHDSKPPTDEDMVEVFAEANQAIKAPQEVQNRPTDKRIMSSEVPVPGWAGEYPGAYRTGVDIYKNIGRPLIETAGMVGGGVVGAGSGLVGGPGGAVAGGALGASLGYGIARSGTGALDQWLGVGRGEEVTPGRVMKRTAQDLALGAFGGPPAKAATPVLRQQITPEVDVLASKIGVGLSPAERTGSRTLAQVESLLEQVPFSSDILHNWRGKAQVEPLIALRNKYVEKGMADTPRGEALGQQIKDAIENRLNQFDKRKIEAVDGLRDDVLRKLGSKESYETLSKDAQKVISDRSLAAVQKKNELYRAVADVIPEGNLPFNKYQETAKSQYDELSKLPNVDSKLKSTLRWGSDVRVDAAEQKMLDEIAGYPPSAREKIMSEMGLSGEKEFVKDWKTMQNHRNQLSEMIRAEDLSIKMNAPGLKGQLTDEGRRYKLLRDALDDDFADIAEGSGGEVLDRWKTAQAFYSDKYAPIWKQKTIREMAYKRPADLVDVAIRPGSTTEVTLSRKALGDEGFNKTLKPAFTNKLLGAGKDEPFNPGRLLRDLNNYGDETLLRVYAPAELNTLKDIAKTGRMHLEKELPNSSILRMIADPKNSTANTVVDSILGSIETMPNSKTVLKNVTVLNDFLSPQQKDGLKLELLNKVFRLNKHTKQVEPKTMAENIMKYRRALAKYFPAEEIVSLDSISALGSIMTRAQQSAANPSGTAKNVIAWGLANQLLFSPIDPLMKGDIPGAAQRVGMGMMTAVLGPKALARLYMSKGGSKLIMKAMTTPKYTGQGIDVAKKIAIVLGNEYLSDME